MNQDLLQYLRANPPAGEFKPYWGVEDGVLTAYWSGDPDYSVPQGDRVTLYLSLETHEVVGCRIEAAIEEQT